MKMNRPEDGVVVKYMNMKVLFRKMYDSDCFDIPRVEALGKCVMKCRLRKAGFYVHIIKYTRESRIDANRVPAGLVCNIELFQGYGDQRIELRGRFDGSVRLRFGNP